MRLLSALPLLALALVGQGCCSCGAKPGFSISYGYPATVQSQAVLGPQVTQYGAQGLATSSVAAPVGLFSSAQPGPVTVMSAAPCAPASLAAQIGAAGPLEPLRMPTPTCTMDDVCRMLREVLKAQQDASKAARPMPSAPGTEQE